MNFLIVRLSSLGDIIHTLPSFAALKKNFPGAKITWIVEEKGKEILALVPGIDRTFVHGTKNKKKTFKLFRKLVSDLRHSLKGKDYTALDFQGLIKSGLITWISGAKKRFGFSRQNCRESQASLFYTDRAEIMPETIHVIQKNLNLLRLLSIKEEKFVFPVSIPEPISTSVLKGLKSLGFNEKKKLIVLNVGAAWKTKRWFEDRWVKLIKIIQSPDLFPILLWGTENEKVLAENISDKTETPLVPTISIQEVIALIGVSSLVITGDTFALQAACALNRPVVALFGPTNPKRNGPFNPLDKVVFHQSKCSFCYKKQCSSLECMQKINPEEVADLAVEVLKTDERIQVYQ